MIRIELSTPGSYFLKGDSIKYLQIITSHGLIMIFFVVIPLIFWFLANFLYLYHIGSKDVAFPRINSFGLWILVAGYILILRIGFLEDKCLTIMMQMILVIICLKILIENILLLKNEI